ncbi:putative myo-inositol-1-phosphate synthase [Nitrosotalea devaniterrae]|uniref:Putative myo-inositol-1-phosphate synthase n=1 Tax=Nitrosotalea devaniterrae TaxID=1078905 RepID=A0A128A2E4_9ARCH|nr:putative myo-inositol-1-phosphate synthase [Candidatus Nitrosotalea devanaterra]
MHITRKELNDDRQEKNNVSDKISLALIGIGNVSITLVKGFEFYKNSTDGLWHPKISGLTLGDFTVVAAYDIDSSKVGKNVSSLIKGSKSDFGSIIVQPGISDDVTPSHISQSGQVKTSSYDEFVNSLKKAKPDFVVNLISSGMEKSGEKYAKAALDAGCSFFNATSAKTATEQTRKAFESKGLLILGDDLMSQFGGTAFHRGMIDFMASRGILLQKAYQLDVGGNQDTQSTMAEETRERKRQIKTDSIAIESPIPFKSTAGTTEYAEQLGDSRVSYYWMEAKGFLDSPIELDLSLRTNDSTNGCNVIVDSIRAAKKTMASKDFAKIDIISAYAFKSPSKKMHIRECIEAFEQTFVN